MHSRPLGAGGAGNAGNAGSAGSAGSAKAILSARFLSHSIRVKSALNLAPTLYSWVAHPFLPPLSFG